jgi:hypothetical protein
MTEIPKIIRDLLLRAPPNPDVTLPLNGEFKPDGIETSPNRE